MSFQDIKGQSKTVEIIQECIRRNRLVGGYIFAGQEAVGKKFFARTLAKAVNCFKLTDDSCDSCPSCKKIDKNEHPDLHLLADPQRSAIKIEQIRRLQKDISLRPYEGKRKVFIIDNAEDLTPEAANALLKILEEPPANSLIILISAKPNLLFKTIISRCKIIKFTSLKRSQLQEILAADYSLDNELAHFLAYFSEGSIGKALALKGTDILRSKNRIIDEFVIEKKTSADYSSLQNKEYLRQSLNILAGWFRDIYLVKTGMPHTELINLDRKDDLLRTMSNFSFIDLDGILNFISDALLYLEQNINVKLLISNLRMELWKA
ncbi:DNA polymerase III subunit delta' [bacterium]|nr:MAG: DNA polymerase III subunit delta' [bacterium]